MKTPQLQDHRQKDSQHVRQFVKRQTKRLRRREEHRDPETAPTRMRYRGWL